MPHWDANGNEQWVCQKGAHVCIGKYTWVDHGSELAKKLGCHGNVCDRCMAEQTKKADHPISLMEYCKIESGGLEGQDLMNYVNRYYGHG